MPDIQRGTLLSFSGLGNWPRPEVFPLFYKVTNLTPDGIVELARVDDEGNYDSSKFPHNMSSLSYSSFRDMFEDGWYTIITPMDPPYMDKIKAIVTTSPGHTRVMFVGYSTAGFACSCSRYSADRPTVPSLRTDKDTA